MTGELFINDKDAWETWGVNMGDGFLEELLTPAPAKAYVTNKSRLESGKEVFYNTPKLDERDLSLTLTIQGNSRAQYLQRYESFLAEIAAGQVRITVPILGRTYKVYYTDSPTRMSNHNLMFGKFIFAFNEPNPADRESL